MKGIYEYDYKCLGCGYEHNYDGGYCPKCKSERQNVEQ